LDSGSFRKYVQAGTPKLSIMRLRESNFAVSV